MITTMQRICEEVAALKPGQCIKYEARELKMIPSYMHNDVMFTPPHRVLGNIIGSAYTHSFSECPVDGSVTFRRHENNGTRYYSAPDDAVRLERLNRDETKVADA